MSQQQESKALWTSKKEEFIKSNKFEALCSDNAVENSRRGSMVVWLNFEPTVTLKASTLTHS